MKKLFLLLFLLCAARANAATRYVDGNLGGNCTGNYSIAARNCSGSDGNAYTAANIDAAMSGASIGDTILLRGGTYGTGIDITPLLGSGGTVTWIGAYQSELVIIKPPAGQSALQGMYDAPTAAYFVFDDLDLDGGNNDSSSNINAFSLYLSHHITIQGDNGNCKIHHWTNSGAQIFADDNIIRDCEVHHNGANIISGTPQDHGLYVGGNNNLVFKGKFYNNLGYGVQQYDSGDFVASGNRYESNEFYACGGGSHGSANPSLGALVLYHGTSGTVAVNNTARDCPYGIQTGSGTSDPLIYSNTIYNVEVYGIDLNGSTNAVVRNNIHWGTGTSIGTAGSTTPTQSYNLCVSGCTGTGAINASDPLFVNAGAGDFHIPTGSPAKDSGTDLGSPYNVDIAGVTRPQGIGWDIGAHEFAVVPVPSRRRIVIQY